MRWCWRWAGAQSRPPSRPAQPQRPQPRLSPLQELSRLTEDASVYKLIGPALVKQDMVEAKSNVTKRLEYIKSEVERLEKQMKELDGKTSAKQQEVGGVRCGYGILNVLQLVWLPSASYSARSDPATAMHVQIVKLQRAQREAIAAQ